MHPRRFKHKGAVLAALALTCCATNAVTAVAGTMLKIVE
jgi:hypothetical protein